jgi:hypothetical protein
MRKPQLSVVMVIALASLVAFGGASRIDGIVCGTDRAEQRTTWACGHTKITKNTKGTTFNLRRVA